MEPPAEPHQDPSVVWISLYNYLVTRNNGVEPGNMPKAFNEPDAPSTYPACHHGGWLDCQSVTQSVNPYPHPNEPNPIPARFTHTHTCGVAGC